MPVDVLARNSSRGRRAAPDRCESDEASLLHPGISAPAGLVSFADLHAWLLG